MNPEEQKKKDQFAKTFPNIAKWWTERPPVGKAVMELVDGKLVKVWKKD